MPIFLKRNTSFFQWLYGYMGVNSKQKRRMISFGIRQKTILVLMSVLFVALGVTGWVAYLQQERDIILKTSHRGEDVARFIAKTVAMGVIGYDYHSIQFMLDEIVNSQDVVYAKVVNRKGNVMAESGQAMGSEAHWLIFYENIVFDEKVVGKLTMGLDNARIIEQLNEQKRVMVTREAITIILIGIGEFIALSFLIIRPVRVISNSLAKGVDEGGKITEDIPITSHDEFGVLAELFNSMRLQLNNANRRLQNRIESADGQLRENNEQLLKQSSELQKINQELQRLTVTDPLTGLYNRRHFEMIMETDIAMTDRHDEACSLVVIDIDFFKKINDSYGHKVGDHVLVEVAKLLKKNLRKTDTLCRIGGEEFVALCRRADENSALIVAEKVREKVAAHLFYIGGKELRVTVSLGVESLPSRSTPCDMDNVFRRADTALYYSKQHGRNKVTHHSQIQDEMKPTSVM